MVNRWNRAMAVGLRHNHDISFIATQRKTMALVYYITNYATKVEDPVWKRVAAAAEFLPALEPTGEGNGSGGDRDAGRGGGAEGMATVDGAGGNRTRVFLLKAANRVFTERPLSQVEVVAHLLGYPFEFGSSAAWAYVNVNQLYWAVFRRWRHLRRASGAEATGDAPDETVVVEEAGPRIPLVEAYRHRGELLRGLCLYDYASLVRLRRDGGGSAAWGEVPLEAGWASGKGWVQALRRPGKGASVRLDGYLSKEFSEEDEESYCRRAAVQHLALFVPWESFVGVDAGDINDIWARARGSLAPRIARLVDNVQLLRRSAEDAKRDAKQWAATSEEGETAAAQAEGEGGEAAKGGEGAYRAGGAGDGARLIDVVRNAASAGQVTAQSTELLAMTQQLCRFQQSALGSAAELAATVVADARAGRQVNLPGSALSGAALPRQEEVRGIKSQQKSAARERERAIQGIQGGGAAAGVGADRGAALRGVMGGFGEDDMDVTAADGDADAGTAAGMRVRLGPSSSFVAAGRELVGQLTLNEKQSVALLIVCRQLDRIRQGDGAGDGAGEGGQLCLFIGGEGGTGKSRVIEALVELLARRDLSSRLLVTATSGTAAARINGITLHSACGLAVGQSGQAGRATREIDGVRLPGQGERFVDGRSRMDWQEKEVLVIDEVSMLGARTLHAANEQLCRLRGSARDFGGIPVVIFCGDFHQFRPVQERSILLPSAAVAWDEDGAFAAEQRRQHDKAHALWRRFTTVVMLDEQMRAAGDPELRRLLGRIRRGEQDRSDLELLNSRCHRPGRRIPWETGLTVVTPLNRNRWNLNLEAALAFRAQRRTAARVFLSEHKWKGGVPTEEEAALMLGYGDDSATPVPAVFVFVPGMPVVVNQNTHQGLKLVNGAGYTAVEVIPDRAFPGHRVSAELTMHFGPPAGIVLASETTKDFHFVGMPAGTILLTPISVKIDARRKRPWQRSDVSRRGLPCAAAFACTDYKEANFCAGATQIHTHSATCAPWRLVERTALTADGVLEIRRTHSMVNRWNRAMAVGLRHNHDISFIATQRKTMALIYYITNYATKVEDPVWKRVAAAAEFLPALEPTGEGNGSGADRDAGRWGGAEGVATAADPRGGNKTRTFLLKAANRVFTERPLSQVEVIAHLLGYPAEFSSSSAWAYVNANQLYWAVFRRWRHLRRASGAEATGDAPDETVVVEEAGPRIPLVEAYRHRGELLRGLCLYDYASLVRLKRNGRGADGGTGWGERGRRRVVPPKGGGTAPGPIRAVESFLGEEAGDIDDIWARARESLAPRVARLADNVQLLRRSAEDAKRDAKQWAATAEEGGTTVPQAGDEGRGAAEGGEEAYRAGGAGDAARLIDVVRNAAGAGQVTAQSTELLAMTQQLCRFQQSALGSAAELAATVVAEERAGRRVNLPGSELSGAALPRQEEVRAIKSQQRSAARERERAIQGIQGGGAAAGVGADRGAALRGVMGGFGEDDMDVTAADGDVDAGTAAGMRAIALVIVCRQLDRIRQGDEAGGDGSAQLCLFIGGEGGTGKSRVIEALVELLARRDLSSRLLVTATSGTAAARINGITLHSACGLTGERFVDGRSRMDWQEKEVWVIDEVSMLGARTLHAANEQTCRLRGSARDFGGIPVVIFCGDFHQFRPVQERSILLPSAAVAWVEDGAFAAEQRRQHDKAHALWRRFTTVVMLDEQMRAAGDPELRRLLGRIRRGEQDRSDLELLNSRCHRPGRRIPWETGLTVVTPLNRNRWNLNLEAALAFRARRRTAARVFLSEHKWREGLPTEEEALLMLGQGDDSATPVPAVFVFVPGMPVVVNQNTHQGLKLVNGAGYTAVDVIPDRAFPGHRVSAELTMHFGPPAGIVLASETTRGFHFVGMPAGTILLTPISVKITAQRKRPWQRNDVSRRGLPCAAAFACTDYKVQGGTLERVALELRGRG
ncbi:PIF1-like helicase [Hirsutella rhossiliensis]